MTFKWLWERLKQKSCTHEFALKDLRFTEIQEPEPPIGGSYEDWCKFFAGRYTNDSFTKRVVWPCAKCGKVFYAHCGLDITPKHGYIRKEKETT